MLSVIRKNKGGKALNIPKYIANVIEMLETSGYEAYAVGGCVRDKLLSIEPSDYDVCTSATPDKIKECFASFRVIPTGEKHGTITVLSDSPVEITTFRTEGVYTDNRHPDKVTFVTSVEDDLSRRDFTVNAMAYSPRTGVIDPFGGREDLRRSVIRCVGDPDKRFNEDGLRIMRGLRFASTFGFSIDEETAASIHKNAKLLEGISAERLYSEMTKLLLGRSAHEILREFPDVIGVIIPEILPMIGFDQMNPHHHLDVWEHTLHVLENCPREAVFRWSALFHDIAKPECAFMGRDKKRHFNGHPKKSADIANAVMSRLRCDNATKRAVVTLVENHDQFFKGGMPEMRRVVGRLGVDVTKQVLEFRVCDSAAQSPATVDKKLEHCRECEKMLARIIDEGLCCSVRDLKITGRELMALGAPSGAALGHLLDTLVEAVIDGKTENEREELQKYAAALMGKVQ